jgi:hypothetical protein
MGWSPRPVPVPDPPTLRLHPLFHLRNLQDGETANFRAGEIAGSGDFRVRGVTPGWHGGGDPLCELSGMLGNPTVSTTKTTTCLWVISGGVTLPAGTIPLHCLTRFTMTPTARLFMGVCDPPIRSTKKDGLFPVRFHQVLCEHTL